MFFLLALAKEEVSDADMAEMIHSEIENLSTQMKELEENIKVPLLFFTLEKIDSLMCLISTLMSSLWLLLIAIADSYRSS